MRPMNNLTKMIFLILFFFHANCFALEKIFYILHNSSSGHKSAEKTLASLGNHANKINILISQAYHIDKKGVVTGFINNDVIAFSQTHAIKLMAMITNSKFDKDISHHFLASAEAQKRALNSIIDLCKRNHLYGVQFDFEMIAIADKSLLTHFYQTAAEILHKNGFIVSFAVPPILSNGPFPSQYQKRMYKNFGGAYDFKALGKSADFITIMAYDQHIGRMAPGPTASIRWVEEVIKYALKSVSADKISLGIPVYSGFWYTGMSARDHAHRITVQNDPVSYDTAMQILEKNKAHLNWDAVTQVNYAIYSKNWLNQYLFFEDARSFKAKLDLVRKYHLRGISVFRIGIEDVQIWNSLNLNSL